MLLLTSVFSKLTFIKKIIQEHFQGPNCQTIWIKIRTNRMSVLIRIQTVCKGHLWAHQSCFMWKTNCRLISISNILKCNNEKFNDLIASIIALTVYPTSADPLRLISFPVTLTMDDVISFCPSIILWLSQRLKYLEFMILLTIVRVWFRRHICISPSLINLYLWLTLGLFLTKFGGELAVFLGEFVTLQTQYEFWFCSLSDCIRSSFSNPPGSVVVQPIGSPSIRESVAAMFSSEIYLLLHCSPNGKLFPLNGLMIQASVEFNIKFTKNIPSGVTVIPFSEKSGNPLSGTRSID